MDYGIVVKIISRLLFLEGLFMLPSLLIAYRTGGGDFKAFLITILINLALAGGLSFYRKNEKVNISPKEGLMIVSFGWLVLSLMGALPLYLSGSLESFVDSFFEIVSGFTTTGATVVDNVEALPKGIIFWRSFSHWIGGMGILVFTLSILPALGVGGFQIFKAESPGPIAGKIAPKIKDTAKILYGTYFVISFSQFIILLIAGMDFFDSIIYTFATVGTGGFASKSQSLGAYSISIQLIVAIFMVISGVNFSLYYGAYEGRIRSFLKDQELRLYLLLITVSTGLIGLNLYFSNYGGLGLAFKDSFFQVGSIITTTGYSTADFDLWPSFSKAILILLMFIGGSAGSTAGGIKVIRILILFKLVKREVLKIFHPRAVIPIKLNGKPLSEDIISGINSFLFLYLMILCLSTILISLEGVDLLTAFTSVVTSLSNVGPGLNLVGPTRTFSFYSPLAKVYLSFLMLLGRLELFTIIALLAPRNWRREV